MVFSAIDGLTPLRAIIGSNASPLKMNARPISLPSPKDFVVNLGGLQQCDGRHIRLFVLLRRLANTGFSRMEARKKDRDTRADVPVRCPYCVEGQTFRKMEYRLPVDWYICLCCGHRSMPSRKDFVCSCQRCRTKRGWQPVRHV